ASMPGSTITDDNHKSSEIINVLITDSELGEILDIKTSPLLGVNNKKQVTAYSSMYEVKFNYISSSEYIDMCQQLVEYNNEMNWTSYNCITIPDKSNNQVNCRCNTLGSIRVVSIPIVNPPI